MKNKIRGVAVLSALLFLLFQFTGCAEPTGTFDNRGMIPAETVSFPGTSLPVPFSEYETYAVLAASYDLIGETSSATATGTDLVLSWSSKKEEGSAAITVALSVALTHPGAIDLPEKTLIFSVDGREEKIPVPAMKSNAGGREILLERTYPKTVLNNGEIMEFSASFDYRQSVMVTDYYGAVVPVFLTKLETKARIPLGDVPETLSGKALLPVNNVMQTPELPNGCEITALTIVLNYYGFSVDKLTMADTYLPKEEDTYTADFYKTFAGNPRNQWRAFGCYSPVIVKSAEDYLTAVGKRDAYEVSDISGASPEELYLLLDAGCPVVVWMTQYIDATPKILKTWTAADGEEMNWKHPLHCVVLIGYDRVANTVTIADPLVGIVSHNATTFALRYKQLGTQAVLVRPLAGE